ncbi:MAG: NUDIX hydrolase [Porticoccaceae bacterium]|tara:strand:- start:9603 stop:10049 length:447 start_codon:yes stop_codon:yes gene_type:complete
MPDKIHLTVATIVVKDNRYLMVKEIDNGQLVINQPAGHVETGEDIIDAAIRETYEETGWHVAIKEFLGIYSATSSETGITYYRLAFTGEAIALDKKAVIDSDIEQVVWMESNEIHQNKDQLRSELVIDCLNDYEQGKVFPLELFRNRL